MLPGYTVDYEVFSRPAERSEKETALQRAARVTDNARFQKAAEALEQIRSQGLIPFTLRPDYAKIYRWLPQKPFSIPKLVYLLLWYSWQRSI